MRFGLILALLMIPLPAWADYAVFYENGGSVDTRTDQIWRGTKPVPGVHIPATCIVLDLPDQADVRKYRRVGAALVLNPPAPAGLSAKEQENLQVKADIDQRLKDTATTDADFVKLLRIREMTDPAARKVEIDKIKAAEASKP